MFAAPLMCSKHLVANWTWKFIHGTTFLEGATCGWIVTPEQSYCSPLDFFINKEKCLEYVGLQHILPVILIPIRKLMLISIFD